MIQKKIVIKNFNKSSNTYDKFAKVQRHMAEVLIDYLDIDKKNNKKLEILEIGAGTGILTEKLLNKFPNSNITIMDISESMLEICKKKFGVRLNYLHEDAENYFCEKKYDLIVSNATFQWFSNIENSVKNYKKIINKDGKILFSIFSNGTYKELNYSFSKILPNYKPSNFLIEKNRLIKLGNILKEEIYLEEHDNLLNFLKSIKGIGAQGTYKYKENLTKKILNLVEDEYLKKYKKIKVTNKLIYIDVS